MEVLTSRMDSNQAKREVIDGITVYRHFSTGLPLFGRTLGQGYGHMMGLAGALAKMRSRYDVIHVHQMLHPAWMASKMGRLLSKPVVVKVSNTGERFDLLTLSQSGGAMGRYLARSMRIGVARAIAITSVSVEELTDAGFPREKIAYIPNGVDLPPETEFRQRASTRARLGVQASEVLVTFLGTLTEKKDVSTLLDAFSRLIAAGERTAKIHIMGDGPLREALERQADGLGLANRVRFMGQVDDPSTYLIASDIFVLPSRVEGLPNALLEAMACQVACVVTPVGGNLDVVLHEENGLVTPVGDAEAMARMLLRLLEDRQLRERLAAAGRQTVENRFAIEKIAKRHLELYNDVLGWPNIYSEFDGLGQGTNDDQDWS